jgi:hypothetical protein
MVIERPILLTGMTASQLSLRMHDRSCTFAGLLRDALRSVDHGVHWMEPDVEWTRDDLRQYSTVIVGIAPPTSLAANRVYGALNVIDHLLDQKRVNLYLFLDAPEPARVWAGLRATEEHPEGFTKPFFSNRKGYRQANDPEVKKRLLTVVERLLHSEWPSTLYPALPWHGEDRLAGQLPSVTLPALIPTFVDDLISPVEAMETGPRKAQWATEPGHDIWLNNKQTTWGRVYLDEIAKQGGDLEVLKVMANSSGTLIAPYRDGTWWSPRFKQSLLCGTPVVTEWRETRVLGEPWSLIINRLEGMSDDAQRDVAHDQQIMYDSWTRRGGNQARRLVKTLQLKNKVRA